MKIANFSAGGHPRLGLVEDDQIIDLAMLLPELPKSISALLREGDSAWAKIRAIADTGGPSVPLASVRLHAPVPDASKFLAIGMNYKDHAEEARKAGVPVPDTQVWFNKQVSCIAGPYDNAIHPSVTTMMDYEAELCVVIGQRCRHVSYENARSVIGGYMVCNDFTARDWQRRSPTWTLGKSFDTHGPVGPWFTTADEIADPHALDMRLTVNGELRQQCVTGGMINDIFAQIEHLTTVMTLEPGDLIATGTCSGVGIALNPPQFLVPGDVVRVEIDGLGHIENRVVAE